MITNKKLVIWRFVDGKPGHEAQTKGLVDALGRITELEFHDIVASSPLRAIVYWLLSRFPVVQDLPSPDYLLGAGHATHWSILAARRAFGGMSVVLMRPSLPLSCFDCCVIPEHDNPPGGNNVISTKGVLNPVVFSPSKDETKGLILIGGESRHYRWDDSVLQKQLQRLLSQNPGIKWSLTDSRRTPDSTSLILRELASENLQFVPHTETPPGWVAEHLKDCGQAWVTPDSVSMLYEALTACNHVGVLKISSTPGKTRVATAVDTMIAAKQLSVLDANQDQPAMKAPLAEADRVAQCLLNITQPEGGYADS